MFFIGDLEAKDMFYAPAFLVRRIQVQTAKAAEI